MTQGHLSSIESYRKLLRRKNVIVDDDFFDHLLPDPILKDIFLAHSDFQILMEIIEKKRAIETVSRDEILSDLRVLKKVVRAAYGGYAVFEDRGLDWNKFFLNWSRDLEKKDNHISVEEALAPFNKIMGKYIDNHFRFVYLGVRPKTTSATVLYNIEYRGFAAVDRPLFTQGKLKDSKILFGPLGNLPKDKQENLLTYEDHNLMLQQFGAKNRLNYSEHRTYGYFRIPTFAPDVLNDVKHLTIFRSQKFNTPLIVDLRSNKGFSNEAVILALNKVAQVDRSNDYLSYFKTRLRSNKYARCMALNFSLLFYLGYKKDKKRIDLRSKATREIQKKPNDFKNIIENKRPVIVLINRFVSSDGEALVHYFKHFRRHLIIGENTSGSCEFVEPGLLVLPKTKLPLLIPRGYNLLKLEDQKTIDGYGLSPQIYLDRNSWSKKNILKCIFECIKNGLL